MIKKVIFIVGFMKRGMEIKEEMFKKAKARIDKI
jgi:hypothetical protein